MRNFQPPAADGPMVPGHPGRWPLIAAVAGLVVVLGMGVPIHLCMPLAVDTINYDLCARTVLQGGVLYRDAFDTNLPGAVWVHCAVRTLLGQGTAIMRWFDLGVLTAIIFLLVRYLIYLERPRPVQVGTAALLAAFYFSRSEWNHCQRDIWMLLPALAAAALRQRQVGLLLQPEGPARRLVPAAAVEGCCWGMAVWIKPFVLVPALACWLVSLFCVRGSPEPGPRRRVLDAVGLLTGGALAGAAGLAWLAGTGAWPWFWDVQLRWNVEYYAGATLSFRLHELLRRSGAALPWSLAHLVAIPLALAALATAVRRREGPRLSAPAVARALMAALYLGWLLQAVILQAVFEYHLTPAVLLALTIVAGQPLPRRAPLTGWGLAALFIMAAVAMHPLARPERLLAWPRCWQGEPPSELRQQLRLRPEADSALLDRVAHYLQGRVGHGELTAYHAGTIRLYGDLQVVPATRYLLLDDILRHFPGRREQVLSEVMSSRQRYVVTDLVVAQVTRSLPASAALPREGVQPVPDSSLGKVAPSFPWTEPVVFRAGRYLVHEVRSSPVRVE